MVLNEHVDEQNELLTPEQMIALEKVDAFAVVIRGDETPLQGLSGRLDWRLCGLITQLKKQNAFQGASGECVLLPFKRKNVHAEVADKVYKLILVGSDTKNISSESISALKKNVKNMGFKNIGVSKSDFGTQISKLKDGEDYSVWIAK